MYSLYKKGVAPVQPFPMSTMSCSLQKPALAEAPPIFPLLGKNIFHRKYIQQIHAQMIITGFIHHIPSVNKFISQLLSANPTSLTYACMAFHHTHQPNIVIWNTIIRCLVNHHLPKMAILSYVKMLQECKSNPDRFTFPSLLKGCAQSMAFNEGKILHGQIVRLNLESDLYIQTTLIKMYADCGDLNSALIIFEKMGTQRNQIAWTAMISGYARNQCPKEALSLFNEMENEGQEPDEVTMVSVLSACGELKDLNLGQRLHFFIEKSGMKICVVLGTALIDMYAKCGELDLARQVFDTLPERNVVTWSAMVSAYVQNNRGEEGLRLFRKMVFEANEEPNEITILAVISACAQTGDLILGRWVHAYIDRAHMNASLNLQNSLIDMYSKCGRIDVARQIFDAIPEKDIISWNTMINGLSLHGLGEEALSLFSIMLVSGVQPDDITFIGVLSACSHAGLVLEGHHHYQNMTRRYGIAPKLEHYGCMVDLLSRAGHLEEAKNLIQQMPMKPNGAVWGALLSACRLYNNVELGKIAAKNLLHIEPYNDGVYVLLSNIFAGQKQWAEVRQVRNLMHERGIQKTPGCSSIVVDGITHVFLVGDHSHPESEKIYLMLNHVMKSLKQAGYIAETSGVLLNIDEEEKEDSISQHSEKLAICFGLMKTRPGAEMLILKNLRVCADCHSAIKHISKVFQRKIIVRDRSRFHHFKDGYCSWRLLVRLVENLGILL